MFFLCLANNATKSSNEKIFSSQGKGKIREKTKKKKELVKEAKDTIRKIRNTATQIKTAAKTSIGREENRKLNPAMPPKLVETPLPPLNRRNGVQLCPQTTAITARINKELGGLLTKKGTSKVTTNPFKKSRTNTKIPHFLPNTRVTLVAPMLPEPKLLISLFFTR